MCTHQPAQANISPFSAAFDVESAFRCPYCSGGFTPRAEGKSWVFCSHPSWRATAWHGGSAISTAGSHISILNILKAWCLSYRHVCAWNKGAASHPPAGFADKAPTCSNSVAPRAERGAGRRAGCMRAPRMLCMEAFQSQPNFSFGIGLEAEVVSKAFSY